MFRKLAVATYSIARLALGHRLLRSDDKRAWPEAVENIRLASEEIPDALSELSGHYFYGRGMKTDRARGVELFVRVAEAGSIAVCYFAGNGQFYGRNPVTLSDDEEGAR
ncbi:MAG: sel1 repeat family protein [Candidatus Methanomethylophilaceae archaeon]|nr:sel1 repeat family protein [Candidatus Methanomethylophilaceae archaeon]